MVNEYGAELDRNGYAPSILKRNAVKSCHVCLRNMGVLQRHEVFHGSNRSKSKEYGLWIEVCHICHYRIHNGDGKMDRYLKEDAQRAAMEYYGWSLEEWIKRFGKNYI